MIVWGPIYDKSYDELRKNIGKSLTYEKVTMSMSFTKNLRKTCDELTTAI